MHVLLVGPDLEENLSLRYLSSSLKKAGHETTIAAFDEAADAGAVLDAAKGADLVGLSLCYQVRAPEFLALARSLKAGDPRRLVVAGGHYASCAAREILSNHPEIDVIVVHEGERTLVEIASAPHALAQIPGIVHRVDGAVVETPRRAMLEDLDVLPWPDRSGPARLMVGVPTAYMMGSRGCLSTCDYCCISTLHRLVKGKRFRQRSVEDIADEMAHLYHDRGVRQFIFHDDNFLVPQVERNMERIEALDRAWRKRGLRHIGLALKCRPADVDRQAFLRLREMGLLRVFLGIESGTAPGLASIGRRQTVEDEHRALGVCEDLGISTQYTIIIFHPEATPETMLADLAFVRRHPAHPLSFCRAEIYAGTPLEQRMMDASRARGTYLARAYGYTDPVTEVVWRAAKDLLFDRCWSQSHLMGQVIRVDHLSTVFRHFYDGREVDALAADVEAWELEVNHDTVGLFEDVILACRESPSLESAELQRRLSGAREREVSRRQVLWDRGCALREALHEEAYRRVGLPRSPTKASVAAPRKAREGVPRHAAAVLLAIGLLSCKEETGIMEAPPPPVDSGVVDDGGVPADAGDGGWVDDGGVIEAPPPPVDAGDGGWVDDGGVMEAPPPPVDAG